MTPRKLSEWFISLSIIFTAVIGVIAIGWDFYHASFPRLESLLGTNNPRIEALLLLLIAAIFATFVIFIFRGSRSDLTFQAIGIQFKGPAAPSMLWAVVFTVSAVSLNAISQSIAVNNRIKQRSLSAESALQKATIVCSGLDLDGGVQVNSIDDIRDKLQNKRDLEAYEAYVNCIEKITNTLKNEPSK